MTKLETVRRLPLAHSPVEAVEAMRQLQQTLSTLPHLHEQLMRLPQQTSELAAAIEPLAKALEKLVPRLDAMDQRLKTIEAAIPKHEDGRPRTLAANGTLQAEMRKISEALSRPFGRFLSKS